MWPRLQQRLPGFLACAWALAVAAPAASGADEVAAFYAGRTITFVSGSSPGASYDVHSRLVARHLSGFIPGRPAIIVQNMPGAGSKAAANHLYTAASRDGSVIGMFGRGVYLDAVFGIEGTRFDPLKFNWIGSHGRETSALVAGIDTPFKTFADLQRAEMLAGTPPPGSDVHSFGMMFSALAGAKLKLISGYPGLAAVALAMERGEVQGIPGLSIASLMALRPQWLTEPGKARVLVQLGASPHATLLQGVPMVHAFAQSETDRKALDLMLARLEIAYPLTAPPEVPAARVAALRAAFALMVASEEFLADAAKLHAEIAPSSGERVLDVIAQAYAAPKDVIARAKAVLEQK